MNRKKVSTERYARHPKNGVSHTEGTGLSHTATLGVTQTVFVDTSTTKKKRKE